jgi:hypothetical protein
MKKQLILILLSGVLLASCKKSLPDVGNTAAVKMANEWWVTLDLGNQKDYYGIGHFKIATYNASSNDNKMWVDDFKNGWGFKTKVTADYNALTFSLPAGGDNLYFDPSKPTAYPSTVKITNGKVLLNAAHSRSGNVTDSIYFNVEFSDDPGTIYTYAGCARTRFNEDDY